MNFIGNLWMKHSKKMDNPLTDDTFMVKNSDFTEKIGILMRNFCKMNEQNTVLFPPWNKLF